MVNSSVIKLSFIALLCVGFSCTSVSYEKEVLSDYYWEIQSLKQRATEPDQSSEALRELGAIYLRTWNFEEGYSALSMAAGQNRSDSRTWLYAGLAKELVEGGNSSLEHYMNAPMLTSSSIYNLIMRGRIAWLTEKQLLAHAIESISQNEESEDKFDENKLVVLPLECSSNLAGDNSIGAGLSELISSNLQQIPNMLVVPPQHGRLLFHHLKGDYTDSASLAGELANFFSAGQYIYGNCTVSSNDEVELQLFVHNRGEEKFEELGISGRFSDISNLENDVIEWLLTYLRVYLPDRERRITASGLDQVSFMLFSEAVHNEDEGNLAESIALLDEVIDLSPVFRVANSKREHLRNKLLAMGNQPADLIQIISQLESADATNSLYHNRIRVVGNGLGAKVAIGSDARKLPPGGVGELPLPPSPSGNNR